ncbi:hypothetical protein OKA04_20585 [Luteolibacter flavescens]|uniref:DUF1559 domain-containing protein n=1 Tax=Luteolibacter flavescens TaxID=1859460 RepID=A0ABT3FU85_9BACT|nr:hypothetical protein [Luteolibacter flavescens]MCW1887148.1 hypothetical protein [Luteolibacter flavescens]
MNATLPPQPPPDVPAPPPGPEAVKSRRKMKGILWIGIACMLTIFFAGFIIMPSERNRRIADRTEASQNIRQVHIALLDFESEFGSFPDTSTSRVVKTDTGTKLNLGSGSSSNELFRQLIAYGVNVESIFWAKTAVSPRKPNNVLGSNTLAKGECGFTYIAGLSSSSDPSAPLMMTPVIPGTWEFDPKPFQGKAVVLHVDGSVKHYPIDKDGHVIIGGLSIFDPRQPYWRGKGPDIKWPE